MNFIMAWRNIWRHPRRSILTIAAIVFATMLLVFMLSWQFGAYDTMIDATVKIHTGHIQIQAQGYQDQRDMRKVVPDPNEIERILTSLRGVKSYTFRAEDFSLVSSENRTYGVLVIGIDPQKEPSVSTLEDMIRRGRFLEAGDRRSALAGEILADNLNSPVGGDLVLLGQGRDGSIAATVLTIKGIFNTGQDEFDRTMIHIPLEYFQELYNMRGAVHMAVVLCDSLTAVPAVKERIAGALSGIDSSLAVLDWKELNPGLVQAIQMDLVSGFIFYLILIIVVAFSIMNTFLMAVFERTREFGVMMSMGMGPGRLMGLLLMESLGITLIGVVIGTIAGAAVTWYFQIHGMVIPGAEEVARQFGLPERMFPQLSFLSIAVGAGIVLILTVLSALYPAFKVKGLKPVEALSAV
ncbi:MAG: FtsX-like permease family protein [Syntrophales bacterium]|jgi:ABC-type lipoprotein release transport system permease subunit|nr:FtsX-like permease family protein [Syntrophales bacterium]